MDRAKGGGRQVFQCEIPIRHRIQGVGRRPVEAEHAGGPVAVDGKRRAGQGGGAERAFVQAPAGVGNAAAVAAEHLDIGEQVVAERHRLCRLEMRVAGHHRVGVLFGPVDQDTLKRPQPAIEAVEGIAHPQPEVGGDLVVAAAGGVQSAGHRPDPLGQRRLHIHVNVLQRRLEHQPARCDVLGDLIEPGDDRRGVVPGQDAGAGQHLGMGLGRPDVLVGKAAVEVDGRVDALHDRGRSAGEAAAPQGVGGGLVGG